MWYQEYTTREIEDYLDEDLWDDDLDWDDEEEIDFEDY